jgi:hypothetical protein
VPEKTMPNSRFDMRDWVFWGGEPPIYFSYGIQLMEKNERNYPSDYLILTNWMAPEIDVLFLQLHTAQKKFFL